PPTPTSLRPAVAGLRRVERLRRDRFHGCHGWEPWLAPAAADALQLDARLGAPGPQTSGTPYLFSIRVIRACRAVASRVGGLSVVACFFRTWVPISACRAAVI